MIVPPRSRACCPQHPQVLDGSTCSGPHGSRTVTGCEAASTSFLPSQKTSLHPHEVLVHHLYSHVIFFPPTVSSRRKKEEENSLFLLLKTR